MKDGRAPGWRFVLYGEHTGVKGGRTEGRTRAVRPPSPSRGSNTVLQAGDASKGGEGGAAGGGGGGGFGDDLSWAKDAEPILDTHLGEGASLFRAEDVRDAQGRLRPAPQVLLNPMRMADKLKNPTTTVTPFEVRIGRHVVLGVMRMSRQQTWESGGRSGLRRSFSLFSL